MAGRVIVTVTLNPALHVRYQARQVRLGARNQVSRVSYRAGGRGLAVARVLHTFGHEVVAAGLAGGASGEMIRAELAKTGVPTHFTWISGESRRVVEVNDESGTGGSGTVTSGTGATVFAEPSPYITTEELGRLAADYRSLMVDASAAVLCGSLPAGLPAETYGSLASYAAEAGVPVIVDAGGEALRHAITRRPALVIPDPATMPDPRALVTSGAGAAAIMSDAGVAVVAADATWTANLACPHGLSVSRDAIVAGFVPGQVLGWSWPDTLAHAVALGASAGPAGDVDLGSYERLLPTVTVTEQPA